MGGGGGGEERRGGGERAVVVGGGGMRRLWWRTGCVQYLLLANNLTLTRSLFLSHRSKLSQVQGPESSHRELQSQLMVHDHSVHV